MVFQLSGISRIPSQAPEPNISRTLPKMNREKVKPRPIPKALITDLVNEFFEISNVNGKALVRDGVETDYKKLGEFDVVLMFKVVDNLESEDYIIC